MYKHSPWQISTSSHRIFLNIAILSDKMFFVYIYIPYVIYSFSWLPVIRSTSGLTLADFISMMNQSDKFLDFC